MMQPVEQAKRLQSLTRLRAGFALGAFLLPLALFLLFERQARRLDALARQGESVEAVVTAVSNGGGTTHYAYQVNGIEYTWNVARADAPFSVGRAFKATYLPGDPSLSRPIADRGLAATEAANNRRFSWKVVLGVGVFFLALAGLTHRDVRRARAGAVSKPPDPKEYRQRLAVAWLFLLTAFAAISEFHYRDAVEKGESVWPVAAALGLTVAIVSTIFFLAGRGGLAKAQERSGRILRWAVPIGGAVALLRVLAMLLDK